MVNASRITALMHWLQAGAPGPETHAEVVTEIGGRLNAAGVPAAQIGVYKTMIHPEVPARLDYWTPDAGTRVASYAPEIFGQAVWLGTPAQVCISTGRTQVITLGQAPEFDTRDDVADLRTRGYTQLVCLPLHSRYTPMISAISIMTKRSGGFEESSLDALNRLQGPIARVTESFILYESTVCKRRSNTGPLRRPDHPAAGGAKFRHWVVFHRVDGRRGDVLSGPLPEDPACVSSSRVERS